VVDKPNFLANPAVVPDFQVSGKMDSNPTSNNHTSAHRCAKNSKNCWPKGTWREGIGKNEIRDQPPKSNSY